MIVIDNSEQIDNRIYDVIWDDTETNTVCFSCKTTEEPIMLEVEKKHIEEDIDSCDMCGSHGCLYVQVECDCGDRHKVVLSAW